jgi:hypothetical protein
MDDDSIDTGINLIHVPDFGLWHLNIKQAAELVVLDMWYSGEFPDIEEPEDWEGNENDPRLKILLAGQTDMFEQRLANAINNGKLKTAFCLRDFDERLSFEDAFINFSDLQEWLGQHGYYAGDAFQEWEDKEAEVASQVCEEIAFLRAVIKKGRVIRSIELLGRLAKSGKIDESNITEISAAYKSAIIENQQLKEKLNHALSNQPTKTDRPLTTRQRRTLLTMIAALCDYAGIDPQTRGVAQRIKVMTESIGTPVDDETIKKILAEIPDAIESRMK